MVSCNEQNITLSRGQTGTFSCDFTAPTFNNKIDLPFQIDIEYQYWVDNSISIKVLRPL